MIFSCCIFGVYCLEFLFVIIWVALDSSVKFLRIINFGKVG